MGIWLIKDADVYYLTVFTKPLESFRKFLQFLQKWEYNSKTYLSTSEILKHQSTVE